MFNLFFVAEKLGKTVAELENTLSLKEFNYWLAYFHILNTPDE